MKGEKYIHIRNLIARGQIETGIIIYVIHLGIVYGLWLRIVSGLSELYSTWLSIGAMVGLITFQFLIGWLYDKHGLIHADNDWTVKRTELLTEMRDDIKTIIKRGK